MLIVNILRMLCYRPFEKFQRSLQAPCQAQSALREILFHSFLESKYGRSLQVTSWNEIPIVNYTDLSPWIRIGGLSPDSVKHYVQTSGSTNVVKYIPYTQSLKNSFVNLFKIWTHDLLGHALKPKTGKIFMSISPPTSAGIKDDSQYLGSFLRFLLKPFLIFPPQDTNLFQNQLAKTLLQEESLEIISIWNPSYLTLLLRHIEDHREDFLPFCSPERRKYLEQPKPDWSGIWPKLQLISCWTSGWARQQAQVLQNFFPNVFLQGKGLLATEAPMTVPLYDAPAPVPLLNEVFFEFEDSSGTIFLIDEIQLRETYQLIISQRGGLVRYRIGDSVRVVDYYKATPCLDFVGRAGAVCDMVGEKLDAAIVEKALNEAFKECLAVKILLPMHDPCHRNHYLLLTDTPILNLTEQLEQALQCNYHYRVARVTGQLEPVKVIYRPNLLEALHQFYSNQGLNLGDIKTPFWISDPCQAASVLKFLSLNQKHPCIL